MASDNRNIFSHRPEVPNQGVGRAGFLWRLHSLSLLVLAAVDHPRMVATSLQSLLPWSSCLHICVSVLLCVPLIRHFLLHLGPIWTIQNDLISKSST